MYQRIAFNMDCCFSKCRACGKQALTMLMGFGCNAVGVTGCRIIDSPRERLIAILTNSFVPCNGRFPTILAVLTIFFATALPSDSRILHALAACCFAHLRDSFWSCHDFFSLPASLCHDFKRRSLLLHTGTAPLQKAPDMLRASALYYQSDSSGADPAIFAAVPPDCLSGLRQISA